MLNRYGEAFTMLLSAINSTKPESFAAPKVVRLEFGNPKEDQVRLVESPLSGSDE